jgi:hypothetical protein
MADAKLLLGPLLSTYSPFPSSGYATPNNVAGSRSGKPKNFFPQVLTLLGSSLKVIVSAIWDLL